MEQKQNTAANNHLTIDDLTQGYLKSIQSESKIDLSFSRCGVNEEKALAAALVSGKCPEGLVLNLAYNLIGVEGGKALADALASGQCPNGLVLDLGGICKYGEAATALADALRSGKCPNGLVLDLAGICKDGEAALEKALKSGKAPYGTKIVGLGTEMEQLCRDNDTNITKKTTLLTLLSTKTPNLPIIDNLVLGIAPYLPGSVSDDKIKLLISKVTHIKKGKTPRSISDKLRDKCHNLVRHPATLTSSLSARVNLFQGNVPPSLHGNFKQNRAASTPLKADSQTKTPPP